MDGVLIFGAAIALLVMAWYQMDYDTRREMTKWFWLMMVVGATAGIAWQSLAAGRVIIPNWPGYHDNWNY